MYKIVLLEYDAVRGIIRGYLESVNGKYSERFVQHAAASG